MKNFTNLKIYSSASNARISGNWLNYRDLSFYEKIIDAMEGGIQPASLTEGGTSNR